MDGKIGFDITEDGGVFSESDDLSAVSSELNRLLDQRDDGVITSAKYLKTVKALVERHPQFIDGHAHLGAALLMDGKPKLALQAYLCALDVAEQVIPAGFSGLIQWGYTENRPFLRANHGAALCHIRLGKRQEAQRLMEKILAWNPNDNQGVRFLIGSAYLRAGETEKAERIFADQAEDYPPYRYEQALMHLKAGDYVRAVTSLRLGFLANGYIAEMLSGNPDPAPLAIWHGTNLAEPEIARDYLDQFGDLWRRTPSAVYFLRWAHMHPKVLIERAAVLESQESLLWEHDFNRRGKLIDRMEAARARIDDVLSKEIVKNRIDRQGRSVEPWRHLAGRRLLLPTISTPDLSRNLKSALQSPR